MYDVKTVVHSDVSERRYTFQRVQDVEDIVEGNKALRSEAQRSDWGRHVARVPMVIIEQWLNEEARRGRYIQYLSSEFNEWFARRIKQPDAAAWRVDNPGNPFYVGWGK